MVPHCFSEGSCGEAGRTVSVEGTHGLSPAALQTPAFRLLVRRAGGVGARDCYLMCGCPGAAVTKHRNRALTDRTLMRLTALQPEAHSQGVLGPRCLEASGRSFPPPPVPGGPGAPQLPSSHGLSPESETRTQPP